MAQSEQVRDLDVNPNVSKTVTLDMDKIVPLDNEGDEVYVSVGTTTHTNLNGESINPIYVREFKSGYFKSSGFKNEPFTITSTANTIQVSIDGSAYRDIILEEGTGLSGENIAEDIRTKIAALAAPSALEEGKLEFLNCSVEWRNNRFKIVSGTFSNTYTGVGKSSVSVIAGSSNDASVILGFDLGVSTEELSSKRAVQTTLSAGFTASGTTLNLTTVEDMNADEAYTIFDGTNREYFIAEAVTSGASTLTVAAGSITNDYSAGAGVQKIFERDPDGEVASPHETIDDIYRQILKSMANQIDYTS
jgi:hypothetical protein